MNKLILFLVLTGTIITSSVVIRETKTKKISLMQKNMSVMDLQLPENSKLPITKPVKMRNAGFKITLESDNTLVLRGPVTGQSVAKLQQQALAMSQKLSVTTPIYLVLDTPGGSVFSGLELIDHLRALPQQIHTITLFAASMGFQITQNMDKRYITNQGTLMSHRARLGGLGGQLDGEFESRYEMVKRKVDYMDAVAAKRMSMDIKDYKEMIINEYWVHGFDSIGDKAADEVVSVNCGTSLTGVESIDLPTMFGQIVLEFSKCPLIRAPLKVDFKRITKSKLGEVKDLYNKLYFNKSKYVDEFILTNKYITFFGL